ncbi:hypothetical protein, no similarity [Maudiozyma saulgeensis]|uniref:Mid2 domain-containing protein n=1 Tax=Maudiozyma saulgeensis TaxID=1789683 RepID=A0A1X7R274_9SACH|nr:hypothetical protein, no similarity [Kazachstania saulgeensis]
MGHIFSNNYIFLATLLINYCHATLLDEHALYNNGSSSVSEIPISSSKESPASSSFLSNTEEPSISSQDSLPVSSTIELSSVITTMSESSIYTSTSSIIIESTITSVIPSSFKSDYSSESIEVSWSELYSYVPSSESIIHSSTSTLQNPYFNSTTSSDSSIEPTYSREEVGTTSQVAGTTIVEVTTVLPDQTVTIDTNTGIQPVVTQKETYTNIPGNINAETNMNNGQNTALETTEATNNQLGDNQVQTTTAAEDYNPYHPERPQVNNDANTNTDVQYTVQTAKSQSVTTNTQLQNVQGTAVTYASNANGEDRKNTKANVDTVASNKDTANNEATKSYISQNTFRSDTKTLSGLQSTTAETNVAVSQQTTDKYSVSQTQGVASKITANDGTGTLKDNKKTQDTQTTGKSQSLTNTIPENDDIGTTRVSVESQSLTNTIPENDDIGTTRVSVKSQYTGKSAVTTENKITHISSNEKALTTKGNTADNTYTTNTVYSKESKVTNTKVSDNTATTAKVKLGSASSNKNSVVTNASGKMTVTNNGVTGAAAATKTKSSSKSRVTIPYTLSANNNWLPSSIIIQTTKASKSATFLNPSSFPTSLPAAIAAGGEVSEPSNTTLVTIGFGSELNYNFLVDNPLSSAQIFNFLPEALLYPFYVDEVSDESDVNDDNISYESIFVSISVSDGTTTLSPTASLVERGLSFVNNTSELAQILSQSSGIINTMETVNRLVEQTTTTATQSGSFTTVSSTVSSSSVATIDSSLIKVKQISPYIDPERDYVVSVAEVYFPSDFVDSLKAHFQDKNSVLYDNPVPSLKSLMNLTDSSVALQGLVHSSDDSESSTNSEESNENEQEASQVFKSSIKNGTQYGSLDVTGIKGSTLPNPIRNRLIIFLTCMVFGTFMWVFSFLALFKFIKRRWFVSKSVSLDNPRRSILNITKIGLYGDDIGSLWSGDSSNSSDSFNEKVKNIVENRRSRHQRQTRTSGNGDNLSLCYNNFIQNANGDTLITSNGLSFSPVSHEFADYTHQIVPTFNSSEYETVNDSFDFDLANTHNNPFSDNYRISPKSKTIDLFRDDLDENFEIGEEIEEEESVADIDVGELDELDEELYKNLMGTIKGRDPNDPLSIEAKKLMAQIGKQYPHNNFQSMTDQ